MLALILPSSLAPLARSEEPEPRPLRDYLHDVSEPIPGVSWQTAIVEQHRVRSTDGAHMDTWIMRPPLPGRVPLILTITPYHPGGDPLRHPLGMLNGWSFFTLDDYLRRGYAIGLSSVRGSGNSEGCFLAAGRQEAIDSAAVIEAMAARPWSNGRVGLIGLSYDGTTAQDVWVEAPPSLKTIVPAGALSDFYTYHYVNGVPISTQSYLPQQSAWPFPERGGVLGATDPGSFVAAEEDKPCPEQADLQREAHDTLLDGNKDAYWQERDFLAELNASGPRARASVYFVHGLEDWNVKPDHLEDWLDALWASEVPVKAMLGQWGHRMPDRADWLLASTAWFDQFLKGVDTGILDAPPVQVASDDGMWRHETRWPPMDPEWLTLHPDDAGAIAPTPGSGSTTYSTTDGRTPMRLAHVPDLYRDDLAQWESEPLERDLHLAGQPVFEADVTACAERAALMLTLLERGPGGDRAINYGAISLNHVQSINDGDPNIAGTTQRVRVRFFPQDDVVRAGNRLVLVAAGNLTADGDPTELLESSGLVLIPPAEPGTITVDHASASLRLPVDVSIVPEPSN